MPAILIAARMFLGGLFGKLWRWLGTLNVYQLACIALIALVLIQHFAIAGERRHSAKVERALTAERAAHAADVARYKAAVDQARAADAAHKVAVETAQDQITKESTDDYQTKLADLRARYDRLRAASSNHQSGGRSAAVPGFPDTAGGSDEGTAQNGLSLGDALICSTNSLQLVGLQEWLRRESAVPR